MEDTEIKVTEPENQEKVAEPENQNIPDESGTDQPISGKAYSEEEINALVDQKIKKRIGKLTAEKYALKERLQQYAEKVQEREPEPPDPAAFMNEYGQIDKDAYKQSVGIYNEQRDAWKEEKAASQNTEIMTANEMSKHQAKFIEKGAKLAEQYPDWYTILNKDIWTSELTAFLWSTENAELALYLGKHEQEAKRIGALGKNDIDAMEAELEAIEAKMKTPVRNAVNPPPPITPVDDSTNVSVKDLHEIKDPDQWYEEWKRQKIKSIG